MHRTYHVIAAAAVLVAVVTACGPRGGQRQGPPPLAVSVATAERRDIATYLSLDGQIAPLLQSTLSTQQAGTVVAVYANEGDHVVRGQLLAKLDDSLLRAQLAQQQATVAQERAVLRSSTLQGIVTAPQAESTIVTARQQLQAAQNNVETAQAALANAQLTYTSNEQLLPQGYVSRTAFEQARSDYVSAQQGLNNAREQESQAEVALKAATAAGNNAVPIQDQQIAQARATLQAAQAAIKLLQTEIAQTSLTAPFDGEITQRLLDPGAYASPNQPIVQISQIDRVYVDVNVPDTSLAYVHPGTPLTFTTSSVPNRIYRGTVFDVNAIPTTGTLSYRARVVMPNPDDSLRGGMLVAVSVQTALHRNAIVVPRTAVAQDESGASDVFTVAELPPPPGGAPAGAGGGTRGGGGGGPPLRFAQAHLVPVAVGLQTDTESEVISSQIHAGTTVITSRPDALQDKSTIAIGPASQSSSTAEIQ